jgi:hypothetical protein
MAVSALLHLQDSPEVPLKFEPCFCQNFCGARSSAEELWLYPRTLGQPQAPNRKGILAFMPPDYQTGKLKFPSIITRAKPGLFKFRLFSRSHDWNSCPLIFYIRRSSKWTLSNTFISLRPTVGKDSGQNVIHLSPSSKHRLQHTRPSKIWWETDIRRQRL